MRNVADARQQLDRRESDAIIAARSRYDHRVGRTGVGGGEGRDAPRDAVARTNSGSISNAY